MRPRFHPGSIVSSSLALLASAAYGVITVPDGTTLTNSTPFVQTDDYELDAIAGNGGGTIVNNSAWMVTGGSNFNILNTNGQGTFTNSGLFDVSASAFTTVNASFNNTPTGAINVSSGSSLTLNGGGTYASGSVLNVASPSASLVHNAGTYTFSGGTFNGSGYVELRGATVNLVGNIGPTSGPATGGLYINGGASLNGSGILSVDHANIFGSVTNSNNPTLRITGNSSISASFDNGGTIINEGIMSAGSIYTSGSKLTIINNGSLSISTSFVDIINRGNLSGSFDSPVTLEAGTILNGVSFYAYPIAATIHAGSITNGSTIRLVSNIVLDGNLGPTTGPASGILNFAAGGVSGNGMISVDKFILEGVSGNISGVTLRTTGTIDGFDTFVINTNTTYQNDGHMKAFGSRFVMTSSPTSMILNKGTWEISSGSGPSANHNYLGGGKFSNEGQFTHLTGHTSFDSFFENKGTLTVTAEILELNNGSAHTSTIQVASGATLSFLAGTHVLTGNTAILKGTGIVLGTLGIADGAIISPGNSPGTLQVGGSLNFTPGGLHPVVLIEIAGTAAGQFDVIQINNGGSLNLGNGTTDLNLALSFGINLGQTYRFVDATLGNGLFTGRFANAAANGDIVNADYNGRTYGLAINYDPLGKFVDLLVVVPEPSTYATWVGVCAMGLVFIRHRRFSATQSSK